MPWSSDRTGFPVVELKSPRVAVQLLPVCKLQFERFLAEPQRENLPLYGDVWYESLLTVLRRVPLRDIQADDYEPLLVGGIQPAEVERFARWLGPSFDLPRIDVWRSIDLALGDEVLTDKDAESLRTDERLCRPARELLTWWLDVRRPDTWAELAMLHGGLLEWVRVGPRDFGGLGRPRREFYKILLNPQRDPPAQPIRKDRVKYFGFRLVRPL